MTSASFPTSFADALRLFGWTSFFVVLLTSCARNQEEPPCEIVYVKRPSLYYLARDGDSLDSIAQSHGMTVHELHSLNRFGDNDVIVPGQRVLIRPGDAAESLTVNENNVVATPLSSHHQPTDGELVDDEDATGDDSQKNEELSTKDSDDLNEGRIYNKKEIGDKSTLSDTEKEELAKNKYEWPVKGEIIQGFSKTNPGINIKAPEGTPVKCIAKGIVKYDGSEPVDGFGILVMVQHADQTLSLYGNLKESIVKNGMIIKRGQILGKVGKTGNSKTTPQLHFQIRATNKHKLINPITVLK